MSADDFRERSDDPSAADEAGGHPADGASTVDAGAPGTDAGAVAGTVVTDPAAADADEAPVPDEPVGTFFFMILFILLLVGLWGTVFWMLLNR